MPNFFNFDNIQQYHYIIKKTLLGLNLNWAISMTLVNRLNSLPYLMVLTDTLEEMLSIKSELYFKHNISIDYNTISVEEPCDNNDGNNASTSNASSKPCIWESGSELYEMDIYGLIISLFKKCIGIPRFYGSADRDDNLEKIFQAVFMSSPDGIQNVSENTPIVSY